MVEEKLITKEDIKKRMEKIKHKIAVLSAKGGVGKSTVAALIAVHYARKKHKVGIFDVDMFGPSIPKLFGIEDKKVMVKADGIEPTFTERYGIKVISIHYALPRRETPVIWMGPVVASTIRDLLGKVEWGELDYLIFDLPPGTGDEPLVIMENVELDGAVVVMTPHELSMAIVEKAINMARKLNVEVLGIVENMSYIECPKCGEIIYPFGRRKVVELAKKYSIPILAEIPIDSELARLSELGRIEDYEYDFFETLLL